MAFVDELVITAYAGDGGNGVVRWRHERDKRFGGPSGGDGGKGGDVYVIGRRDIMLLGKHRHTPFFSAERGGDGEKNSMHGKNGEDLYIDIPIGSVVTHVETGKKIELLKEGDEALLLKGGQGGYGNEYFKSSRNVRPTEHTFGKKAERGAFLIELELVVDAGFVGLPNAGKSSLLNALTSAHARVGSYPFTTLDPNLGDLYGFILADIPGLIEGAAEGKGLGHKFLRHIRRTRLLIHLVSLEENDVASAYETVRRELNLYGKGLSEKPELVVLTKADLVEKDIIRSCKESLQSVGVKDIQVVSVIDDMRLKTFQDKLATFLRAGS